MITLPEIKSILDKIVAASKIIDAIECDIPSSLKTEFGRVWGKAFVVKTDLIKLNTTQDENGKSCTLENQELIKCACAVELYEGLELYKAKIYEVAEDLGLSKSDTDKLGTEDGVPDQLRNKINAKIDSLTDLDPASKARLKTFATGEKKDRENEFGSYKGLARPDSFWPAAAEQFNVRVDHKSYLDDVIHTLKKNRSLTESLRKLIPKHTTNDEMAKSFIKLCKFCKDYSEAGTPWAVGDLNCIPAQEALKVIQSWADEKFGSYAGHKFKIDFSKGAGNFPKVPWICISPPDHTVSDGVFASICFGREGNGAVAGLSESVSNRKGLSINEWLVGGPTPINVNGGDPKRFFNNSFENPKGFYASTFDPQTLISHLKDSLDRCIQFLKLGKNHLFGNKNLAVFQSALDSTGLTSSADVPNLFIKALAAKPFIILTGNSGTGKTKLAELFVQWLSGEAKGRHALVPIGADWTDNRNVLGFVNHLRLTKPEGGTDEIPIYQSTRILDLLLEASKNPSDPFFLILDEMNLSHVERYFADFLSALESNEAGLFLHREGRGLPRKLNGPADVPEELALPSNFFVIGTVNVDETTYMFSPKVLDRANVLEFRLDDEATKKFLDAGGNRIKQIAAAPLGYAQSFLELSHRARSSQNPLPLIGDSATLPPETKISIESCNKVIQDLFGLMQIRHQEFAFRTIVEIRSFLAVDYELAINKQGWDWKSAMDAQILQKILPKLHGSKRKIGVLLAALAKYCEHAIIEEAREFFAKETAADAYHAANEKRENAPQFPRSHNKLCEMIESVRRDQFVSFIQ